MTRTLYFNRRTALWGGLLLLVLVPVFYSLGFWQWNKGQDKLARQAEFDSRRQEAAMPMPLQPAVADSLRYRHLRLGGEYDAAHQFLVDNRVHAGQAGYHVITPLKLAGSNLHVLINRGWVPTGADRRQLPLVPPPAGPVEIAGIAIVPGERFFVLGEVADVPGWQAVWQNLDLQRFRQAVPYPIQPVVIQLDAEAPGGYVREWPRPGERADRNLGYAVQWFGFAVTSLAIWIYFLLHRP